MTRIVIYAHNEEQAALKPAAMRLVKRGAQVVWSAIKFKEVIPNAERVLTLEHHMETVKAMYAGSRVPIALIDTADDIEPSPKPTLEELKLKIAVNDPVIEVKVVDPGVTIEVVETPAVEIPAVETVAVEAEPVIEFSMTVGDGESTSVEVPVAKSRKKS